MVDIDDTREILGTYEFYAWLLLNEMIPIFSAYHISFPYFFALKVVKGPDFCVKLKMFLCHFPMCGQMDKKKWKDSEMGW